MISPPVSPTVLHVLPSFDTGGLGSLGFAMIDAWPENARHIVIAPKYRDTKPDLFLEYAARVGQGNVGQLDRSALEQVPAWISRMQMLILKLLRGAPLGNAIAYNFTDAGLTANAIRRVGFAGEVAAHVGTVLPDNDLTRTIAGAQLNIRFVPASKAVDESLRKLVKPHTKIWPVVWNGVPLEKYGPRFTMDKRPSIVFGFSGRMANPPVKDWGMLFDAFKLAAIPGAQLRIAGDGRLRAQLEARAKETGCDIVFTGQLDQKGMIDFLSDVDVFVMAALPFEGFSMALVEAIASGCMIIGTDVPSVREVFEAGGEPGFMASNASQLAALMKLFPISAQGGNSMRRDNYQMVQRLIPKLDAKRMARSYWEIK